MGEHTDLTSLKVSICQKWSKNGTEANQHQLSGQSSLMHVEIKTSTRYATVP